MIAGDIMLGKSPHFNLRVKTAYSCLTAYAMFHSYSERSNPEKQQQVDKVFI